MVRLYDRVRRDGLESSQNDDLVSVALTDMRAGMPFLVVDNAAELWFTNARVKSVDPVFLLPYVDTLFIEARLRNPIRELITEQTHGLVPEEIGAIAVRTDLWGDLPGTNDEKSQQARDFVTQQIANSYTGLFIDMPERTTVDPVRWMVDYHLICFDSLSVARPIGPVASISAFLRPDKTPALNMNGQPLMLSLLRSLDRESEQNAISWLKPLWFGLHLGWAKNMSIIACASDPKLARAYRRRHGHDMGDPMIIVPNVGPGLKADIAGAQKPEISYTRLDVRPGAMVPAADEGFVWLEDAPPVANAVEAIDTIE